VGLLGLFSLFVLIRGHNEPGGGFIGGLLAGSALALYALANGVPEARRLLRVDPRSLIAGGAVCLVIAAVASMFAGQEMLTGLWLKQPVPGLGKVSTVLVFDVGVYLAVMGMALLALFTLGEDDEESHGEEVER
jgi:multicomponent Na+:H+ antiporter subunit B